MFCRRKVNFENPNFNIGLPVFTIHGNHDDPAGSDNLSAVDMLSTCSLVNYFGKTVRSSHLRILASVAGTMKAPAEAAGQAPACCRPRYPCRMHRFARIVLAHILFR